jgi:hypothetical protein
MKNTISTTSQENSFQVFKRILLNKIRQNKIIYYDFQNLSNELEKSIVMLAQIQNAVPEIWDDRDNEHVNLISPEMYQKIAAYYEKHKNKSYSSKYKIDRKIHNMLMKIGKYLEKVDYDLAKRKNMALEMEKRYYSLTFDLNNRMIDYLAFLSKTIKKIAIKFGILGTSLFYGLSFMSVYAPELLEWLKFVFIFNRMNDLLLLTSYAISPNRKEEIRRLKHRVMDLLGIYRRRDYGLYIKFVYKLYDILNAMMSFMKNLDVHLGDSKDWEDFYGKLEKHMLLNAGISHKLLVDVITLDLIAVDEFIRSLGERKGLDTYRYSIKVSPNAISKLKHHYGEKARVDGNWIHVELNYSGGRYYVPDNPLDVKFILDVSGFDGSLEEKASFVMAAILLSDEMILDNIYTANAQWRNGIISIDLNQLKWIVYKDKSWLVRWIDRVLGRDRKILTPEIIGNELFESYIALHKINDN